MKNLVLWLVPLILVGLVKGSKDPICEQEPAVDGDCRAIIPSFTYYPVLNACIYFEYGGCGGTDNRFSNRTLCVNKCVQ